MCSSVVAGGLIVEGIPLGMGRQFTPRLTMKRVYDTKCFRPERYRHEVANHYRDYKLQQHLYQQNLPRLGHRHRRRRRHRQFGGAVGGGVGGVGGGGGGLGLGAEPARVSASLASAFAQFRDVWPTHVHYFPRFGDPTTTTPSPSPPSSHRGRRTLCSLEPPDETYNDAVRRIRNSHSLAQLRQLLERQLARIRLVGHGHAGQHGGHTPRSQSSDDHQLNISHKSGSEIETESPQRPDFYGYLQLASGYYERVLLANIRYLESIGQQRQKQSKHQHQHQHQHHHPHQQRNNAIKSGLFLEPSAAVPGQKLISLLKSLRRKKVTRRASSEPGIRVNIRSLRKEGEQLEREQFEREQQEQQEREREQDQEETEQEEAHDLPLDSMCEASDSGASTLGATSATLGVTVEASTTTLEAIATRVAGPAGAGGTGGTDHRRLYEIIDNLSQLSIVEGNRRHHLSIELPKITLTDCAAQQVALYSARYDIIKLQPMPNEARPPKRT
ncbi:hypothetical protein KR009_009916 [Drosophila setifemur]|nr:hypothetical protein KR009_009916 [Drosophila setifemur]